MTSQTHIDQLGRTVLVPAMPVRIVSLVPSQTELLADLGLSDRVVGITRFCVHPEDWRKTKTRVGGTKQFDFDFIRSLNPDLIIGNKEENYREGIEALARDYPVWMSDIVTLQDALDMIARIGMLTQTQHRSAEFVNRIHQEFSTIKPLLGLRALYLIWRKPWMAAAPGTFIDEMMKVSGLLNCLSDYSRYPELTADDILKLHPEVVLLSSEPYPFREKHIEELRKLCPTANVVLVDGEMFSWYGSRLLNVPAYLKDLMKTLC